MNDRINVSSHPTLDNDMLKHLKYVMSVELCQRCIIYSRLMFNDWALQ